MTRNRIQSFIARNSLVLVMVFCCCYALLIVFLYRFTRISILDNFLIFLLFPMYYSSVKYDSRAYLKLAGLILAICVGVLYCISSFSHFKSNMETVVIILTVSILFCETIFKDIQKQKRLVIEKQELIEKLEKALSEVSTLSRLLPLCSYCKKIRDDQGYWQRLEKYFKENTNMEFSHSLCPDCMYQYYPDYVENSERSNPKENHP